MNEENPEQSKKPILLFGATGVTGKLIVDEFRRLGKDLTMVGRNEVELKRIAKETGFDFRTVDINSADSVRAALTGASVVINCIGPFNIYGNVVVENACELGVHYMDTTGEQFFISEAFKRFDKRAKEGGIAVTPSCAFEYAVSDALVELQLPKDERSYDIEVYYLIEGTATSVGTRRSLFHQLALPALRYEKGGLVEIEPLEFFTPTTLPDGQTIAATEFGSGEAVLFPLHAKAKSTRSYFATKKSPMPAFKLPGSFLRGMVKTPLIGDAIKALLTAEGAPSKEALEANAATVILVAKDGESIKTHTAEGTDPYALTAVIASAIAIKLQSEGPNATGFCSPSMVAGAEYIRERTKERGVKWPDSSN